MTAAMPAAVRGIERRGRPLRFLALVTTGWIGLRVVMLWPQDDAAATPLPALASTSTTAAVVQAGWLSPSPRTVAPVSLRSSTHVARTSLAAAQRWALATAAAPTLSPRGRERAMPVEPPALLLPGLPLSQRAPVHAASRWSGSAWLAARGGSGLAPGALGGQLGGSQAGVRLAYMLSARRRVALAARIASPLGSGLREAALGVEWQPTRLPIRLVAERRFALGSGTGGPAVGLVAGVGPVVLPLGFRLESYGQAGVIRRTETEPYADGAAHVAHPIGALGRIRFDLGAGAWGAAQRGAARLDLGPSLGVVVPLGQQAVRLTLDWRERVAGDAHPGSGLALTLGADF